MATETTTGSLCTGYAGLDMAIRAATGALTESWFAEIEAAPSLLLAERFPSVKNYGDMTAVDWRKADPVHLLCAGFPCQGSSVAGKQLGRADHRWLWPEVTRCVVELPEQPEQIVVENVANLLRIDGGEAFADILTDLHALGYDARWVVVGACNAGLCHHRHRLFLLATLTRKRCRLAGRVAVAELVPILADWWQPDGSRYSRKWPAAGSLVDGRVYADEAVPCGAPTRRMKLLPTPRASANENRQTRPSPSQLAGKHGLSLAAEVCRLLPTPCARDGDGRGEGTTEFWQRRIAETGRANGVPLGAAVRLLPTPRATDGAKGGPNQRGSKGDLALSAAVIGERFGDYAAAVMRHVDTTGVFPPEPTEPNTNGDARLAPAFPEWMMTLPAGWVTDILDRAPALKAIGNGVVPLQGALAYRILADRAGITLPDTTSGQVAA